MGKRKTTKPEPERTCRGSECAPTTLTVQVRVTPRASRNELLPEGDTLRARLTAPPVEGAANTALVALIASAAHLPRASVTIVAGQTGRTKLVRIAGVNAETFWQRVTPQ
jgi:uncharacterized protein (TIGR00251 family)